MTENCTKKDVNIMTNKLPSNVTKKLVCFISFLKRRKLKVLLSHRMLVIGRSEDFL